jgi:repressor LexA
MSKLSPKQTEVLDIIKRSIDSVGYPPTRAELTTALGLSSTNGVQQHLKALAVKGAIILDGDMRARGIRLVKPPPKRDRHKTIEFTRAATRALKPTVTPTLKPTVALRPFPSVGSEQRLVPPQLMSLPLIGRVAAGAPILAEAHIETHYNIDPALFAQTPDYLLRVQGMSMRDAGILHGDLIAVKRTTEIKSGQIIVARLDDEVTVKRFKRIAGRMELRPENPEFDTIVVATGDTPHYSFVPEGIYVGVIRGKS